MYELCTYTKAGRLKVLATLDNFSAAIQMRARTPGSFCRLIRN